MGEGEIVDYSAYDQIVLVHKETKSERFLNNEELGDIYESANPELAMQHFMCDYSDYDIKIIERSIGIGIDFSKCNKTRE